MLGGLARRIGGEQWQRNNLAATLTVFLLTAGFSFTIPFLPSYLQQIDGLDKEHAAFWSGIATGLGGVGAMLTGPFWGILGDRIGRKPMLVRAATGGSVGLLLFAFCQTTWQVVLVRFFVGVMAGAPAAAMALIAATTPPEKVNRALGMFQAGMQMGLAFGPLIGAGFIELLGYDGTFVVTSLLMFTGVLATVVLVEEDRSTLRRRKRRGEADDGPPPEVLRSVLFTRPVIAVFLVVLVLGVGRPMTLPVLPGFADDLMGDDGSLNFTLGILFFGMAVAGAVMSIYAVRLNERFGFNRVLLLTCVGSAVMTVAQGASNHVVQLVVLAWMVALFQGGLQTGTVTLLTAAVPASLISGMFGFYSAVQSASQQIGPTLGGSLAVGVGFRGVFVFAGLLFLVSGVVAYVILERSTSPAAPPPMVPAPTSDEVALET